MFLSACAGLPQFVSSHTVTRTSGLTHLPEFPPKIGSWLKAYWEEIGASCLNAESFSGSTFEESLSTVLFAETLFDELVLCAEAHKERTEHPIHLGRNR